MVVDQTPASSFVIFRLVPLSQLPLSVTSVAFGARRRNVTVRFGWISGERSGVGRAAAAGGGAVGGCCATSDSPMTKPMTATVPDSRTLRQVFMGASLARYSKSRRGAIPLIIPETLLGFWRSDDMRARQSAVLTAATVVCLSFVARSQESVDLAVVDRIKSEAFARSEVMEHLRYLTDVHGPRLTGSP